jgi:hypothetical protein
MRRTKVKKIMDNYEYYYLDDKLHRLNGPACVSRYQNGNIRCEGYYLRGSAHCIDKPAFIWYYEDGNISCEEYYIFGSGITKEEFYTPGFIDALILEKS